jgi:hypothetical protein
MRITWEKLNGSMAGTSICPFGVAVAKLGLGGANRFLPRANLLSALVQVTHGLKSGALRDLGTKVPGRSIVIG